MFTDIDKNLINGENMGGIAQEIYFAKWEDIDTWPTKPSNPANLAANGQLTGNVTPKAGKKFNKMYITDDTGEFQIEPVGEKDGKSFVLHLRFFHPGLNENVLGFINYAKNENLVFIVPDNNGAYFLMGDATRPATFETAPDNMGTGQATASRRGVSAEFTYKTSNIYQYKGTIPLTPTSGS